MCVKKLEDRKREFKKELDAYIEDQRKRTIKKMRDRAELMKPTIKQIEEQIFDIDEEVALAGGLLIAVKNVAEEAGQDVYDIFNPGADFIFSDALDKAIEDRFDFWAREINETTAKNLEKNLKEWQGNDKPVSDLVKEVQGTFDGLATYRAEAITNTELGIATSEAKFDGYKQLQIPTKIWTWSPGLKGGERENHSAMDGEEVSINDRFSNGMRFPRDPGFSAGEIINCQCEI